MRFLLVSIFLASLAVLAGCASMSADECLTADWRAIGYEDGAGGQGPEAFGDRRRACAEHGVTAGFEAYNAGRAEGLTYFCRPRNGYSLGTRGRRYSGVCPKELEPAFLAAHADGLGLYERESDLKRLRKGLRRLEARSEEVDRLLAEKTAGLLAPDLPVEERAALVDEVRKLTEEKIDVEVRLRELEAEQLDAKEDYEAYRRYVTSRYGA